MAIYRCNLHPARASAMDHSRYIAREGRYLEIAQKRGEIIYHGVGNMPEWTNDEASRFWEAAEKHERANANHYREFEVALPRELSPEQMEATVKGFSQEQFGEQHTYQYALHLNANNPHAHIMFSEKMNDGLARSEEQYFKRYNPKKPERGGCKKSNEWEAQRGNKVSDRLLQSREAWANHVNRALERAGHEARVDHRSYEARGIDLIPEPKVGPKVWYQPNREQHPRFQEFKAVRLAHQVPQERANLAAIEGNLGAAKRELEEITAAIREMEARELKARQQEAAAARARVEAPQKPQNAPGARVWAKAVEVQESENSPSVAPVRPVQGKAVAPRPSEVNWVWFARFDRATWETRGGARRTLSREKDSPEFKARVSLDMPPKCVLSEDGRTWSGVFRDKIEAANYGRERRKQALVEAQARAAERKAQAPTQLSEPSSPTSTERVLQALSKAAQAKARANVATTQEPTERARTQEDVKHAHVGQERPQTVAKDEVTEHFVDALQAFKAAQKACKASFYAPRQEVSKRMTTTLKDRTRRFDLAKAAARDHAAAFGREGTLSLAEEQLGRENFDLIREIEVALGRDWGLSR